MEKETLLKKFMNVLETASSDELSSIDQLVTGMEKHQTTYPHSWSASIFQMDMDTTEGQLTMTVPINELTHNSLGILHGGMTTTLIDSAMGTVANHLADDGYVAVTTQLNIHFTAPGIGEYVTADVSIIHKGQSSLVLSSSAVLENGKQIAYATATFAFVKMG